MSRDEILREIVRLEILLEDMRLGLRPFDVNEELGLRDDLRALRDRLCGVPGARAERPYSLDR